MSLQQLASVSAGKRDFRLTCLRGRILKTNGLLSVADVESHVEIGGLSTGTILSYIKELSKIQLNDKRYRDIVNKPFEEQSYYVKGGKQEEIAKKVHDTLVKMVDKEEYRDVEIERYNALIVEDDFDVLDYIKKLDHLHCMYAFIDSNNKKRR